MRIQNGLIGLLTMVLLFSIIIKNPLFSQSENFILNDQLQFNIEQSVQDELLEALDELIGEIKRDEVELDKLNQQYTQLTKSIWQSFKNFDRPNVIEAYEMQLMKLYPLMDNQFMLSLAIMGKENVPAVRIHTLLEIVAFKTKDGIKFSLPLGYLTRSWNKQEVGYHLLLSR